MTPQLLAELAWLAWKESAVAPPAERQHLVQLASRLAAAAKLKGYRPKTEGEVFARYAVRGRR